MKTESEVKNLLAIQREFCWQRVQATMSKELEVMGINNRIKLEHKIKGATSPQDCINYQV